MRSLSFILVALTLSLTPLVLDAQTMMVQTVAGNGTTGFFGDGGPATAAIFNDPSDVAADAAGNLFIADQRNHRIRKIDAATGIITTVAGNGLSMSWGDGGPATAASLSYPSEVKLDGAGNMYIAEQLGHRIRKVNAATGIITTIVGGGTSPFFNGMPGTALHAAFRPSGLGVDHGGSCYFIDDTISRVIRMDAVTGLLSTVAGTGVPGFSGDGGPATAAQFDNMNFYPGMSMALNSVNDLFITDVANARVRRADHLTGVITTYAGNGIASLGGDGGPATAAGVFLPTRIATDNAGNIYFFSYTLVRRVDAVTHTIATVAGGGSSSADNIIATGAKLFDPSGLATDGAGHVYYADKNGWVRKLTNVCSSVTAGSILGSAASYCDSSNLTLSLTGASAGADIAYQWQYSTDGLTWYNTGTGGASLPTCTIYDTTYYRTIASCTLGSAADTTPVNTIVIIPSLSAGVLSGGTVICPGATVTWSSTEPGGLWSSSSTAIATVTASGDVTAVAPGTALISYSVSNSCGTSVVSATVTVMPPTDAGTILGSLTVCEGDTSILTNPVAGGTWNSTVASVATVGMTGTVYGHAAGTTSIVYYTMGMCGAGAAVAVVTVNPLPDAGTITGTPVMCRELGTILANTESGGVWSSSTPAIAIVGASGIVTGMAAGTSTISYAMTNTCGTAIATIVVSVNTVPDMGVITGADTVCAGDTIGLSNTVTTGSWSSGDTSIATISTTGIVSGVAAGNVQITYAATNVCGTSQALKTVYVLPFSKCITRVPALATAPPLKIYPNPGAGVFTVYIPSLKEEEVLISVKDATGRQVFTHTTLTNSAFDMNLQVPAGAYLFSAITAGLRYDTRLVVIK